MSYLKILEKRHLIVFEIELVKQIEINIDYILMMVEKYRKCLTAKIRVFLLTLKKAIGSSIQLRNKKELIEEFIKTVNINTDVEGD
ncbi:type I restriction and modification enzyme subunit R-like protein [Keratinibaculum paraultunense]|uniref:Type I restriction and modification enzyme subunit R-like protein n=1 Tax=Keratinibaculum paraultunense TaxID=1278232 RepID=A0A4V2UU69_9FIRM|nr:type I restriction and modification enzyme subunit R-like protein [Keratinibaculum paraultunense]